MLAADGFIEQRPQVGFWVQPVTWDEVAELQRLRSGLEGRVGMTLASQDPGEALEQGRSNLDAMEKYAVEADAANFARAEAAFHVDLARSARFPSGVRVLQRWMVRVRMYCPGLVRLDQDAMRAAVDDGRDCLKAIESGDAHEAMRALEQSVDLSTRRIEAAGQPLLV